MRPRTATIGRRWLLLTVMMLGLCAALGGVGLFLAIRQTRATVQLQMASLRGESRRLSETIQGELRRRIGESLIAAAGGYEKPAGWAPAEAAGDAAWVAAWFVLDGGQVIVHPPAAAGLQPEPPIETAPIWFLEAQEAEFRERSLELAISLYRRCTGPATPPAWQRRSWLAVARCQRKLQRYDAALATYDGVAEELARMQTGAAADRLGVALAAIDTVIDAGRLGEARLRLQDLISGIDRGDMLLSDEADAELVMLRVSRTRGGTPSPSDPLLQQQLLDLAARQGEAARFRELVSGLVQAGSIPGARPAQAGELRFLQESLSATPYLIAYQLHGRPAGEAVVVGAKLDLDAVPGVFVEPVLAEEGRDRVVLLARSDDAAAAGSAWAEPLAPLLPGLRLGPAPSFVEHLHARARMQQAAYVGATLVMAAALFVTVALSVRAVRREWEAARLRSDFVANVSHELKTPLALIRLFGETLLYDRVKDEAKAHGYYEIIARESERLTHLIDNILDFSRIQTGGKAYARATCDVGEIVRRTVSSYTFQLDHHKIAHELTIAPDLPAVEGDADAIAQSVLNLINNAVKYSPDEKCVSVTVSALPQGRGVAIEVRDRGIGISPQDRARLFEPFYRSADQRVRRRRGSGLGLSLVRHMVDAHGGRIGVESMPGKGSTFRIELPAAGERAR